MLRQLDSCKEQLAILSKQYEGLEARSKADRKVLVKEVKSLRNSQAKLEDELGKSLQAKSEAEVVYFPPNNILHSSLFLCQVAQFL